MDFISVRFKLLVVLTVLSVQLCCSEPVMRMIQDENYPAERHKVLTEDGYILTLYRIPQMGTQQRDRKVILLMHGMTSAAPAYLTFGRQKSAGFKLSDAGYDVWIGNARGNTYSRRHVSLDPSKPKFWDFSWHEIGVYDIPATIDYILQHTNQSKLAYVGHSQGVTSGLVMLSERPEYNDKISIFHAMTPPVIFKYNHPMVPDNVEQVNAIGDWLYMNGFHELVSHRNMELIRTTAKLCMVPPGSQICKAIAFQLFGPTKQYYDGLLHDIINHIPAGASYKQFIHYGQIAATGKFQNYHHGFEKNMKIYGTPDPPEYNMTNIRTNIHLLHGTNDWLTPSSNVPYLTERLGKNLVALSKFDGFNHIDFTYGQNLQMVHKKILKILKRYH